MATDRRAGILVFVLLIAFIGVGAYLRLADLRTNPGWYPDEGSDLNIAWNLWHGRVQYFAVSGSLLVAARAPLFHLILAGLFNIFGYDILVARLVGSIAGLSTIPLLFFALKGRLGEWEALAAAGLFAVFPLAILYNRWAFAYNLLMPLFVINFWVLLRLMETRQRRWMFLGASVTGLAILTAWVSLSLVICLAVVGWLYNRRALVWGLPLSLSLPAIFLFASYQIAPTAFIQDVSLTLLRAGGSIPAQLVFATVNYSIFIASNSWLALGIAGLFLIEQRRVRVLVFQIFFITLFSVLRFSPATESDFHRLLGIVPFLILGITVFLWRGVTFGITILGADLDRLTERLRLGEGFAGRARHAVKIVAVGSFVFLVSLGVVFTSVLFDFLSVRSGFATRIDDVLAVPMADATTAVEYVNDVAKPDDVVLASPQLGWAVRARAVDFQQALSYEGFVTDNYLVPIPRERFAFDPTPGNARYAIVDRMWRVWGVENIPAMKDLLKVVDSWDVAFKVGDFVVYRNPDR